MPEQEDKPKQVVTTEAQKVEEYVAPFTSHPESTTPWRYYLVFRSGHTPEAHAKAISEKEIARFAPHPIGPWSGTMTDEYRERVRRDPGVEKVIQYTGEGEWF
jgi:hypothetical protein